MIYPQSDLPIYEQKSASESQVIQLNHNYIWPLGVLRALIIISTLGGLITAWAIPSNLGMFYSFDGALSSTRSALIVLFFITFIISDAIFAVSLSNFVNLPGVQSLAWLMSFCILDILSFMALIAVGITSGIRESQVDLYSTNIGVRSGSFAVCSSFALFAALLQLISVLISIPYVIKLRKIDY